MGALKDCERITESLLGQPVNSLTALAFVIVGSLLFVMTRRRWVAVGSIGTGVGSFLFHGPMPTGAQLTHDLTLWFLVVVAVIAMVTDLRNGTDWRGLVGPLALLAVVAVIGRLGATGGPLCDPDSVLQPHGIWHLGAATAILWWATAYRVPGTKH
ncbi:MAG: hypothetical protein PVG83_03150 [Acidimicrobiia bacterium]|jgi:hypothetical protein